MHPSNAIASVQPKKARMEERDQLCMSSFEMLQLERSDCGGALKMDGKK